jgi:hypothetical protein
MTNDNSNANTSSSSKAPAVAALNVYKKVAIIRGSDDVLTYEDAEGNIKTITDLHFAAVATVRKRKMSLFHYLMRTFFFVFLKLCVHIVSVLFVFLMVDTAS